MFSNPITGRNYIFRGDSFDENVSIEPNSSLAVAVVLFCIAGPFWLMYRLVKYVGKKGALLTSQALERVKKNAEV
jgi:hypothetical protein